MLDFLYTLVFDNIYEYEYCAEWDNALRDGDRRNGTVVGAGSTPRQVSIVEASGGIEKGGYYLTQGPVIHSLAYRDGVIRLQCSPVSEIRFIQFEPRGKHFTADEKLLTSAEMKPDKDAKYVRVEIIAPDGAKAWSNPIFINFPYGTAGESPYPPDYETEPYHIRKPEEEAPPSAHEYVSPSMQYMTNRHPLDPSKNKYKGNLHTHTTNSDGSLPAADVVELYKAKDYNFIVLSDHNYYTDTDTFNTDGFITLAGIEVENWTGFFEYWRDETTRHIVYHFNGIKKYDGTDSGVYKDGYRREKPDYGWQVREPLRPAANKLIESLHDTGHLVMLNHPQWSLMRENDCLGYDNVFAMEIYNNGAEMSASNGFSLNHWDHCLKNGMRVFATATDDFHRPNHYAGGWVVCFADELTPRAIAQALERGEFYATSGPAINEYGVENGSVYIKCDKAYSIRYICDGYATDIVFNADSASFPVPDYAKYVRLEVTDFHGKTAWTNPVFMK